QHVYALVAHPPAAATSTTATADTPGTGIIPPGKRAAWQGVWIGSWLLLFPLFTLADFWVDQALKEFWIALPAIAIVGATWLLALRTREGSSRALTTFLYLIPALLAWQSISLRHFGR